MLDAYANGRTCEQAAALVGLAKSTCKLALRRAGLRARSNSVAQRKYAIQENFFETIDTEEKAYWLGFISADGGIYDKRLTITLAAKDRAHLVKFATSIGPTLPIRVFTSDGYALASISSRSEKLASDLFALGVTPKKSLTLSPWSPRRIELQAHYWRGFIDGDGCLSEAGKARSVGLMGTLPVVNAFLSFAHRICGTNAKPYAVKTTPGMFTAHVGGSFLATTFATAIYEGAGVYLDRKYEIFRRWNAEPPSYRTKKQRAIDIETAKCQFATGGITKTRLAKEYGVSWDTMFAWLKR